MHKVSNSSLYSLIQAINRAADHPPFEEVRLAKTKGQPLSDSSGILSAEEVLAEATDLLNTLAKR